MKKLYISILSSILLVGNIIAQPTITSFSPTTATVGTEVNIIGTNYDETTSNNIVRFNGVTASVNSVVIDTIGYLIDHSQVDGIINFVRFSSANADDFSLSVGDDAIKTRVEIRFGAGLGQKAHRFTRPSSYVYQDYVDVPFEVWDVTNNRQLMASFRDQQEDGVYNLIHRNLDGDPTLESREYIYISDVVYDAINPDPNITVDDGMFYRYMYWFWPHLEEGATWDPNNMAAANIVIYYDPTITGSIYTNVPNGATTGPITVEVAAQTGTSSTNFIVLSTPFLSLPYLPSNGGDFETNQSDWQVEHTSGTTFELGNSSFSGKSGTSSGSFAWVTGLNDANYVDNSNASLVSPSFDFSGSIQYKMAFNANFQFEQDWDGFIIQYSIGGGTWTKLNDIYEEGWYNSISDQNAVFGASVAIFSGTTNGNFESFETDLSFLSGNSDVRFKYVFLTDGSVTDVGMALDDFQIIPATGILAFSFPEEKNGAYIRPGFIDIEVLNGTDVTSLIPTFTLNSGATATVNAVVQSSGSSAQNFTNPVIYTVTAQDGTTTQDWTVTVSVSNLYAAYSFSANFLDENNAHNGTELTAENAFLDDRLGFANNAFHFSYHNTPTIELQNTANENFGDELTISAWIRPDTFVVDNVQIITNEIGGLGFNVFLATDDLNATELLTERRLYAGITGVSYGSFGKVLLDRWTHIAFRFKRGVGTTIFINGVDQGTWGFIAGTEDIPIPISTGPIIIGKDYDGMMDEIKIFSNALSDQEIYDEFNYNLWPFSSLAFRGPEGSNAIDWGMDLNNPGDRYVEAILINDPGTYQFRATGSFEVFMGDNELDGVAEPGGTQITMSNGLYGVSFRKTDFEYQIVPITSVGIIGSALPDGWNSDINLTDLGNGNYEITNLAVSDGEWKIRINDEWAINWGSNSNDGLLNPDGANIPISVGNYSFTFDIVNQTYSVFQESNLVAHYTFTGNAMDQSGNGYDGSVIGATLTTDRHGNGNSAYNFNGIDNRIEVPDNNALDFGTNDFTLQAWIRTTNSTQLQRIISKGSFTGSVGYMLRTTNTGTLFFEMNGGEITRSNTIVTDGEWHLVTVVLDRDLDAKIYIDGVLDDITNINTTGINPTNATPLTIGIHSTSSEPFNGDLDGVRIYNIALSETEIADIYNTERALSTTTDILDFTIPNQIQSTTIDTGNLSVSVVMADQTDLTNLVASFVLTDGASATVAGVAQVSGSTPNDFTNTVTYLLLAEDGISTEPWTITVTTAQVAPIAQYTFDGSNATDITGNGYNGTPINNPLFSMDRFGNNGGSIEQQGSETYVSINHGGSWDMQGKVMINAWIRPNELPLASEFGDIIFIEDNFGELDINWDGKLFYHWSEGTAGTDIGAIKVNQWTMVTLVIDSNNELQLYVNGVIQYLTLDGTSIEGESIPINRHTGIGTLAHIGHNTFERWYNGSIDDVRVYLNGVLPPAGIQALYESELSGGLDELVAFFPFDNGSLSDASGNVYQGEFRDVNDNIATAVTNTDRFGNANGALQFDNNGNSNHVFHERSINLYNEFTVNLWINPTSIANTDEMGDVLIADNSGGRFMISNEAALIYHYPDVNGGFPVKASDPNIVSINQWQMVTYTINEVGTLTMYLNGEWVHSSDVSDHTLSSFDDRFIIAQADNAGGTDIRYYHGALDDVAIYQRTLSDQDVKDLFTGETLVAHYTFDGNAFDQSNYGNDGTVNGPILATDQYGNANSAYSFNGTSDDISINGGAGITIDNDITLSMWIYPTVAQGSRLTWDAGAEYGDLLLNTDGTLVYNYDDGASFSNINSNGGVILNEWNMVSLTREGATITFYIDGVLDKTATAYDPTGASNITELGRGDADVAGYFNGILDEVRIYNIALAANDIANIYNAERVIGTQAEITDFSLAEQTGAATIGSNTIDMEVAYNTDVTDLISTFTLSIGAVASISGTEQVSGTTSNDFTNAITYSVTAEDGLTTNDWTITVTVALNTETEITSFSIPEQLSIATIGSGTIDLTVAATTNVTSLVATFTFSDGAVVTVNGTEQGSGSTTNDFTNTVTYVVTAQDGTTSQNWDVTITREVNAELVFSSIPSTIDASFGSSISVDVQDNSLFSSILFLYRGISAGSGASFVSIPTTEDGTIHTATLTGTEDPLGVEYKFTGELIFGGLIETEVGYINITYSGDGIKIPSDRIKFSEKDSLAYRAISIPLNMGNGNSNTIFDELGDYSDNWRLYSFNPSTSSNGGSFQEQSTNGTSIQLGKGYFVLAKSSTSIFTGEGSTPSVTPTQPVEIQIRQGWNLIGNPYNFSIDWVEVLAANTDVSNISQLSNQLSIWLGSYSNSQNHLLSFQGGFVFSSEAMSIKIPVTRNTSLPSSGGRIVEQEEKDPPAWIATIDLKENKLDISRLKIGMHENADLGYDKYDQVSLPALTSKASLKVPHPEFFVPKFSSDLVPVDNYFEWGIEMDKFKEGNNYRLDWSIKDYDQSGLSRVLFDIGNQTRVNMDEVSNYSFKAVKGQSFKIYYGSLNEIETNLIPASIKLGDIYPNPTTNQIVIPFSIPEENNGYKVNISLFNLQGERIITLSNDEYTTGFHQLTWDLKTRNGSKIPTGFYFVTMKMGSNMQTKKIILK